MLISKFPALKGLRGTDTIAVFDSPQEFGNDCRNVNGAMMARDVWSGGEDKYEVIRKCREGDERLVPMSDAFLESFDASIAHATSKFRFISDMTHGVLDVGAYSAGEPMQFRARKRVINEQAPLMIVCDLTLSGGISTRNMAKRGAAILALVRILSITRPISLYVGVALSGGLSCGLLMRVDTTPINVSVAAHLFSHPGVTRQLGYGYLQGVLKSGGGWPYNSEDFLRENYQAYWGRVLPMHEVFYVPSMYLHDKVISDPVQWIKDALDKFGGKIEQ